MSAQDFTISPQLGRDMERLRRRSLIVGVAESLGILFAGADLGLVVVFVILVTALILKPSGLMGQT